MGIKGEPGGRADSPFTRDPRIEEDADFYERLGVDKDTSDRDIRKAFLTLAKKHHSDAAGGDDNKAKLLGEAYDGIRDSERRAAYQQVRSEAAHAAGQGFPDFSYGSIIGNWDGTPTPRNRPKY